MTEFIITDTGEVVSSLIEGIKILETDSERFLVPGQVLDDSDGAVHTLNIFGVIDEFIDSTDLKTQKTIHVSLNLSGVEIKKYISEAYL